MPQIQDDLIAALEEMASFMELAGENEFKVRAYRKGADALRQGERNIDDLSAIVVGKVKVSGVGEGLRKTIQEFLAHGSLPSVAVYKDKIPPGLLEIMAIPGLGPKKAKTIVEELGVVSLGELEYACRENRLLTLKGFGAASQTKILNALERLKENADRYLMSDAQAIAEGLTKKVIAASKAAKVKNLRIQVVGAMARGAETVDLFEFVLLCDASQGRAVIDKLGFVAGVQEKKHSVFGFELHQVEGRLPGSPPLVFWFCNVSDFDNSLPLQQWLCAHQELKSELESKPQHFKLWPCTWLEAHWSGRKPNADAYRRDKHGSVRGVFHNHTKQSDGQASLEEMVLEAEKMGLEYIGISDHSQTAFYAHGLSSQELLAQNDAIQKLQKKVSIRIFHGVESDILQDGALDYSDEVLEKLDFVVGSIHSRFKMDETAMTNRLHQALANPATTFWGHPTGRLLLSRDSYGFDWNKILDIIEKSGVVIELNSNPHRLDVDWRLGAELEKRKISICINPDAHSLEGLKDTRWGEIMAEKAMIPSNQILNLMPLQEMESFLWQRKQKLKRA